MSAPTEVLWVDDDSPASPKDFGEIRVVPVQSCRQAFEAMKTDGVRPRWVIMDLIVPQEGWGKAYLAVPGIDFIRFLKETYGDAVGIVVYTVALDQKRRSDALNSGALEVFEKTRCGFMDVVDSIRRREVKHQMTSL